MFILFFFESYFFIFHFLFFYSLFHYVILLIEICSRIMYWDLSLLGFPGSCFFLPIFRTHKKFL